MRGLVAALAFALAFAPGAALAQADRSLSLAEYAERGGPDLSRAWTDVQLRRAATIIASLSDAQLPRLASPRSGALLARLTDPTVLAVCYDANRSLDARLGACRDIFGASIDLLGAYVPASERDPSLNGDAMFVAGFTLRCAAAASEVLEEFAQQLDRNDPSYPSRLDGLRRARLGFGGMLDGGLASLQESGYPEEQRAHLASIIAETYSRLSSGQTREWRIEREMIMTRLARTDANPEVRAAFARFAT